MASPRDLTPLEDHFEARVSYASGENQSGRATASYVAFGYRSASTQGLLVTTLAKLVHCEGERNVRLKKNAVTHPRSRPDITS